MVWPRHAAAPSAPTLAMNSNPPPILASPVSTAAWSFVMPPISASLSTWVRSAWTWALSLSVTPRACAVPVFTSRA